MHRGFTQTGTGDSCELEHRIEHSESEAHTKSHNKYPPEPDTTQQNAGTSAQIKHASAIQHSTQNPKARS